MPLPEFIPSISSEMRQAIDAALEAIEAEDNIRILFAIESGSRAWGFPSPDSDYDVRFVYARPLNWYLSLDPGRDVIERPINDDLDIGGWDLQKSLKLLLKPNPVLLEWLTSPIRYRWNESECNRLIDLSDEAFHSSPSLYHYLNLGEGQIKLHRQGRERGQAQILFLHAASGLRDPLDAPSSWQRSTDEPPGPFGRPGFAAGNRGNRLRN